MSRESWLKKSGRLCKQQHSLFSLFDLIPGKVPLSSFDTFPIILNISDKLQKLNECRE